MLTYKTMYKFLDDSVHAEVLDFPGVITCGANLDEARRLLASALVDMAETNLLSGEPLPLPQPNCTDAEADTEEAIYLLLKASPRVTIVPLEEILVKNFPLSAERLEKTAMSCQPPESWFQQEGKPF